MIAMIHLSVSPDKLDKCVNEVIFCQKSAEKTSNLLMSAAAAATTTAAAWLDNVAGLGLCAQI